MLKSGNFSLSVLLLAFHTYKAPYNKSLWQACIRWLWYLLFTSSLKPLNWIQRNLTGSKILTSSTIGWDIFGFSETAEQKVAHCTKEHNLWPFWPLVAELLSKFTRKLWSWEEPYWFWVRGRRSWSTLALSVENLVGMIQIAVLIQSL